jgi:Aspartyl protease
MRMKYRSSLLAAALLAMTVLPAAAADCTLKMAASMDTMRAPSGLVLVPVTIAGGKKLLLLDTGGFFSELTPQTVSELGLSPRHIGTFQYDASGKAIDQVVDASDVSFGQMKAGSMQFMVATGEIGGANSNISGVLGPKTLSAYDLDLDFPGNKLQLMSQDHCPGQVVYWPHTAIAAIPVRITTDNHVIFPMELDGHRLQALLDTGQAQTALATHAAQTVFGVSGSGSHRFKTLSVEGITINNPEINLLPDEARNNMLTNAYSGTNAESFPDLLLGMSELQHLHVYVAYKEKMLYITAGGAAPQGGASGR